MFRPALRLAHRLVLLAATVPTPVIAQHPLDALTSAEYWTVYDAVKASGRTDSNTLVAQVLLREPPKRDVLAWAPGQPFAREAVAYLKHGREAVEAAVDLRSGKLISWRIVPGAQVNMLISELEGLGELMKEDPRVRAALTRRGISDLGLVHCFALPPGYYDLPEQRNRRIYRGFCGYRHRTYNGMVGQLRGLVAYMDADTREVLKVSDRGGLPVPDGRHDFTDEALADRRAALAPLAVSQPLGPGFTRAGGRIAWDNWSFHVRIDPRAGPVVSLVRYRDGDQARSVLYQGHLAEIFVPYMDAEEGWYDRNFLDMGEFHAGGFLEPMEPGVDCPANAAYLDGVVSKEDGTPALRRNLACLFERVTGDPAWRHGSEEGDPVHGRPRRDLVLRATAVLGNYDYLLDWVFQPDGAIRVAVGATGMLEVKTVASQMVALDQGGRAVLADPGDDRYGRFVDEHIVAVNHDHFFSFRLDLDVDGAENSLVVDRLVPERLAAGHPRRSLWRVESSTARAERDGMLDMDMHRPALWRFVNPSHAGRLGYPSSYQLVPGHNAMSLLATDDWPRRRAGFIDHHLWVTPYRADERFAAGAYPVLSRAGEGLPAWTKANRPIENTDVVAWYTMGFHHVARAEDWPVMPTAWHSFELRPFDFFDRNPALDLPAVP